MVSEEDRAQRTLSKLSPVGACLRKTCRDTYSKSEPLKNSLEWEKQSTLKNVLPFRNVKQRAPD